MGYKIDHALTNYYGDCLWSIEDNDYSKLDWDASNSKSKPTLEDLHRNGRNFPPNFLHESWMDYLYWDIELEP